MAVTLQKVRVARIAWVPPSCSWRKSREIWYYNGICTVGNGGNHTKYTVFSGFEGLFRL